MSVTWDEINHLTGKLQKGVDELDKCIRDMAPEVNVRYGNVRGINTISFNKEAWNRRADLYEKKEVIEKAISALNALDCKEDMMSVKIYPMSGESQKFKVIADGEHVCFMTWDDVDEEYVIEGTTDKFKSKVYDYETPGRDIVECSMTFKRLLER